MVCLKCDPQITQTSEAALGVLVNHGGKVSKLNKSIQRGSFCFISALSFLSQLMNVFNILCVFLDIFNISKEDITHGTAAFTCCPPHLCLSFPHSLPLKLVFGILILLLPMHVSINNLWHHFAYFFNLIEVICCLYNFRLVFKASKNVSFEE